MAKTPMKFTPCKGCSSPAKCKAAGRCMASSPAKGKGKLPAFLMGKKGK